MRAEMPEWVISISSGCSKESRADYRPRFKVAFPEVPLKRIQSNEEVVLLCLTELVYSALLDRKSWSMPAEKTLALSK